MVEWDTLEELAELNPFQTILPGQTQGRPPLTPEHKFALAMIADAIKTYRRSHRPLLKCEAMSWLDHDNGAHVTFGFCCEILGLDPDAARPRAIALARGQLELELPVVRQRYRRTQRTTGGWRRRWSNMPIYKG